MKINTGKVIVDLEGKEVALFPDRKATIGNTIASIIINYKGKAFQNDHLKILELARKFYKSLDETEIDKADYSKIKDAVTESPVFNSLILGQILEELMEPEKTTEKK